MIVLYNTLRLILYVIIKIISLFNIKIKKFFDKRIFKNETVKELLEKDKKDFILIHMSSVGEFNLCKELINKLIKKGENIIISIVTDTGYEIANKTYKENEKVNIIYFPLDDKLLLSMIYKSFNIKKTIIIETEIWINLYNIASKKGKLYIVNGRLTEKRIKSYIKLKKIISNTIDKAYKILVQSEIDKNRYIKIGADKNKIKVFKNLKYSIKYENMTEDQKNEYYKNNLFENKKIIVCGSTREGEEKIWIDVFKEININKSFQLILVPRHLDRIKDIIKEIEESFLNDDKNWCLLSENQKKDIIIVDKMGVLRNFYEMAHIVFVGGTLVNIGGHSILEPLYYGKNPIIGKYYNNIEDIVVEAQKLGFVNIVENKKEIVQHIKNDEIINTKSFFEKNDEINKIINEIYE